MLDRDTAVLNTLGVYADATPAEKREGMSWYPDARDFATTLAGRYGTSVETATAVVAALSPQMSWDANKRWAEQAMFAHSLGIPVPSRGLGNSLRRATVALSGDLSDIERAKGTLKVHNFYLSILGVSGAVCVDRHAVRVVYGDPQHPGTIGSDGRYREYAEVYREAARELHLRAADVQAVTWVAMRRMRGEA